MIEVILNDEATRVGLGRIAARVNNHEALLKVLGRRGSEELRRWFRSRNSLPNKMNAPKTNFWRRVADATNSGRVEGLTRVRISVGSPYFAQKVFGGKITPKRGAYLTIPVDPASRGRTVSVFEHESGLKLFRLRKKGGALTDLLAAAEANGHIKVYYVLSKGVDQDPDPNALPPRAGFHAAILEEAEQMLSRQIKDSSGSA
jgi:hypothetical protein